MVALFALSPLLTGILGGTLVVALIAGGVMLGVVLGRRRQGSNDSQVPPEQMLKMLQGLSQWTSGMSDEVTHYRDELELLAQRMDSDKGASGGTPRSADRLMAEIRRANENLTARLQAAEATLHVQSQEISSYMSEARTDSLTGLPNRRSFDDELARRLAEFERNNTPVALVLLDIDHFKNFNDVHGHLAGDEVLKKVAVSLQHAMRATDLIARFGGEEFAIVLPSASKLQACHAAERVRRSIECEPVRWEGEDLRVTASCGVAQANSGEAGIELIQRADEALYASKGGGRNLASWHDGEQITRVSEQIGTGPIVEPDLGKDFDEVCDNLRRRLEEAAGD